MKESDQKRVFEWGRVSGWRGAVVRVKPMNFASSQEVENKTHQHSKFHEVHFVPIVFRCSEGVLNVLT